LGAAEFVEALGHSERERRNSFGSALERAGDAYIVKRGAGKTIVAGYPWFTDWGRDTFIALRGLCLATKRFDVAREILLAWAPTVSEGMLPNRFTDAGEQPEYNSVDASLWFVVGVHEYLSASRANGPERKTLLKAAKAIVEGYARGTRFGIRADSDGLLSAGVKGLQLTWMDAKVGDHVITPRMGKPVEIQALWLNALWIASKYSTEWKELFERAFSSFRSRFWNEKGSCLFDVIDVDHQPGTFDAAVRPNQILAVGGLPLCVLEPDHARAVVATVEQHLLTHLGLRSLAPAEAGFRAKYEGGVWERDSAYHQGTVWPWLMGPFVEAWVRVHGNTDSVRRQARSRFLGAVFPHLHEAGLGHISEITDAEPPYLPRGCPWQAWSLGEVLRLDRLVLGKEQTAAKRKSRDSARTAL
jgi:predicted glycogen debranching enzyme